MRKLLIMVVVTSFLLWGSTISIVLPAQAEVGVSAGSVIKGEGLSTLYYVGEDGKRYVFPNDKIYFSWFDDFSDVVEVGMNDLYSYPLGGNVHYKPGKFLVKIQTDPKVYAVGQNGKLRWVKTETLARTLYGANWNLLIDDVPDSFFTNYVVSDPIENEEEYDPEEESDELPTISYNLGFKERLQSQIQENIQERRCQRLEGLITRVQNRLVRFGIEAEELGSDYLDQCFVDTSGSGNSKKTAKRWGWYKDNKVTICHVPPGNPANAHTISVSASAAKSHLAQGSYLGECTEDNSSNGDDDGDEEEDTTAPVISEVAAEPAVDSAVITWATDEEADSYVQCAVEPLDQATEFLFASSSENILSHELILTGLSASTTYYYKVESTDAFGNSSESSGYLFITGEEIVIDETAPIISGIATTITPTTAIVTWETDELSDSKVSYWYATALDIAEDATETIWEELNNDLVTSHSVELTGLGTSTDYFFKVESSDEAGNTSVSDEQYFTTYLAE